MASLPQVAEALRATLQTVPAELARTSGYCQRESKLGAPAFVQTTVLGWWQHPDATLVQLCQTAAQRGTVISPQGLDQRFGPAAATLLAECLAAVVEPVIAGDPSEHDLLARFSSVLVLDSTTITLPAPLAAVWPGCGGRVGTGGDAALKLSVRLDLVTGRLEGPEVSSGRTQDRATALQHTPLPPGALRIADQGYWSLPVLAEIAAQDAYFLSRYQRQAKVNLDGAWLDLPRWLETQTAAVLDRSVLLGKTQQLPARLIALRVPQEVADERRRKANAHAKREKEAPPPPELANWTLLVTNAPAELLTPAETRVLARMRWQIELLFKLWKQHGLLDESRSADPERLRCEVYAKLIGVVLQHWLRLVGCWALGERSWVKVAAPIRDAALLISCTLHDPTLLTRVLDALLPVLSVGTRLDKRRRHPTAGQLLADPEHQWSFA